jgi:signal transduction histidine kinase
MLNSGRLEHVGLVSLLNRRCPDASKKQKMKVEFKGYELGFKLPEDAALCQFRVTKKALGNVAKHSGARSAQVERKADGDAVTVSIRDSGGGFDDSARKAHPSIGLIRMSERLQLARGQLLVKSQPNCGAENVAEVPRTTIECEAQAKSKVAGG